MIFDIDFNRIIRWLTPHFLNKPKHIAWLQILMLPLVWLYTSFLIYRTAKLKEATINSQVLRFTRALRDRFANEGIYILHFSDYLNQAFIYLRIEGATAEFDYLIAENHLPVDYDSLMAEFDNEYDFVVRIPALIADQMDAVTAYVLKYKLAGKRFKVQVI